MSDIPLATRTVFADLQQRCLDAAFDEEFSSSGSFQKRKRGNRYYWYYREAGRAGQARTPKYAGPVTDQAVGDRVRRFELLKDDYRERQAMVRTLLAAGLQAPDGFSARLIEAIGRASSGYEESWSGRWPSRPMRGSSGSSSAVAR
jgi:hypothetical protein